VEIGEKELPTFFIRDASQIKSLEEIVHYDLHHEKETTSNYAEVFTGKEKVIIGLTAGASCPNNLIEATVKKVFELRGEKL
jgi:4-hydroxy-3-methylbut-2-enyl diphosphate reductase